MERWRLSGAQCGLRAFAWHLSAHGSSFFDGLPHAAARAEWAVNAHCHGPPVMAPAIVWQPGLAGYLAVSTWLSRKASASMKTDMA